MIGWIILIGAIAAIVFLAQLSHFRHRFRIMALVIVLLLLSLTFIKVASINSVELGSASGVFSAVKVYFLWLGHIFDNLRTITGNIVRMDWFSVSS